MAEKKCGLLVVVSGFSGAGKGTLMKRLLEKYDDYALSISMTTRNPREGEIEGVSYYFSSVADFEDKIKQGGLIEYANYCGNYYGTPSDYVFEKLAKGIDVILEIEIQGALKIKEKFPEALLLFVMPPSIEELRNRLVGRGTEGIDVINKRINRAKEEAEGIEEYEYIVINDDLEKCVVEMNGIIQNAKYKPIRNQEFIKNIKEELNGFSERR